MSVATITALYSYPIKSCAPMVLSSSPCSSKGLPHDRDFVIASATADKIFTQRDLPKMALLQPSLDNQNNVVVKGLDETQVTIPTSQSGEIVTLNVWGNFYRGIDQGDDISRWLSEQLGVECRLFKRADDGEHSSTLPKDNTRYDASFVDCCPLSVVFEEEVQILNSKLSEPVRINRFRPSIVIKGIPESEHYSLKTLRTNNLSLAYIRPIGRCVIIDIDQEQGKKIGSECLRVLASYKMVNQKASLGHYFFAQEAGQLSVGDQITT